MHSHPVHIVYVPDVLVYAAVAHYNRVLAVCVVWGWLVVAAEASPEGACCHILQHSRS